MILYYVHDPMCSWCWGFRPTWEKIQAGLPDNIEVRYLLGGLAPDSDEPMPKAMQLDIASYWGKIQQHIPGTDFNFNFWGKCKPRRSTYPACRAIIAARRRDNVLEKPMIEAIQKAYYLNAQNPSDDTVLIAIAESLGLDVKQFTLDLNAGEVQKQLESEVMLARKIGAQGFPSLIIENKGTFQTIPLNYNNPEPSLKRIERGVG